MGIAARAAQLNPSPFNQLCDLAVMNLGFGLAICVEIATIGTFQATSARDRYNRDREIPLHSNRLRTQ